MASQRVKVMRAAFGALAVLCLAGWVFVRTAGATAAKEATAAAETRAASYATAVARVASVHGNSVAVDPRSLTDAVQRAASSDPSVGRVRVWDPSGSLAASTDPKDTSGKGAQASGNLEAALQGDAGSQDLEMTLTPLAGGGPTSQVVTQTYVALRLQDGAKPVGAVEVDFIRSKIVSPLWRTFSIVLAAGAAFFGLLFAFSMNRPAGAKKIKAAPAKKLAPPAPSPPRHDYRAAKQEAKSAWVTPAEEAPPPDTSVAELEAATARIAELEQALQRAADETEHARTQAASHEQDIERLRLEASEREATLAAQATDEAEIEALRAKLTEAETRANDAETLLANAREEIAAAHAQVGDTRADDEEGPAEAVEPSAPEPEADPSDPTDLIAVLEQRVAEAEARAQHAKDEAMQLSPEASELRMRLARTAARKKMGSVG